VQDSAAYQVASASATVGSIINGIEVHIIAI
jgi:hypothetical protein